MRRVSPTGRYRLCRRGGGGEGRLLHTLLDAGYVPVIAPIGADSAGQTHNINADTAAAAVAAELQADVFLLLTDVEGVFRDYHDKSSLICELSFAEATDMIRTGVLKAA
jgi:acetylglutamate kinase